MTSTMSYTPGTLAAHDFIPGELLQNSLLSHPKCWQAEWWLFPLTLSAPCGWSRGAGTARLLGSRLGELGGNGWDLSLSGAGTVHFRSARDLRFAGKGWRKLTVGHGKGLAMHGEKHMHRKPAIKWNQVTASQIQGDNQMERNMTALVLLQGTHPPQPPAPWMCLFYSNLAL